LEHTAEIALINGHGASGVVPEPVMAALAEIEVSERPFRQEGAIEGSGVEECAFGLGCAALGLVMESEANPSGGIERMESANPLPMRALPAGIEIGKEKCRVMVKGVKPLCPAEVWESSGGFEECGGELCDRQKCDRNKQQ